VQVINLFGGPGVGKSTAAAGLFYEMKKAQLRVELVTEYAKDAVWEQRYNILDDQIYIFAKQQRRISRLKDHGIDWVITDSPIPLGLVYLRPGVLGDSFPNVVMEVFNQSKNHNFLLQRSFRYDPVGRNQKDETEARIYDEKVQDLLSAYGVSVTSIPGGEMAVDFIMKNVVLNNSIEAKELS
jgi:AAA domain